MDEIMNSTRNAINKTKDKLERLSVNIASQKKQDSEIEILLSMKDYDEIHKVHFGKNDITLLMLVVKTNDDYLTTSIANKIIMKDHQTLLEYDILGNNSLSHAAMVNNVKFLDVMDECLTPNFINKGMTAKNNKSKSAFLIASEHNNKEFIKKIFDLSINVPKVDQEQALLMSAEHGHKDIVEFLVSQGVNVNVKNDTDHTPLEVANQQGHYEVVSLLRKQYPISRFFFTIACLSSYIGEVCQFHSNEWVKKLSEITSDLTKKLMVLLHYLSNTRLSFTLPGSQLFWQLFWKFPFHPIECLLAHGEREKEIIKLFYGNSNHLIIPSVSDHQTYPTHPPSRENFSPPLSLDRNQDRPPEITLEAEFQEATPDQKQAKEKKLNSCKANVLRAQANVKRVYIAKEEEELRRSSSYLSSTPPRKRSSRKEGLNSSSRSTVSSTHSAAIGRLRHRKTRGGTSLSHPARNSSLAAYTTSPQTRAEDLPPLNLLNLSTQLSNSVSSVSDELQLSSPQGRHLEQPCPPFPLYQTP